jgi:hypothetical protein
MVEPEWPPGRPMFFLIDENHQVYEVDYREFNDNYMKNEYRHLEWTGNDDIYVSTIFTGVNNNFLGDGRPPILFETMVFGGEYDKAQWRWSTYEQAIIGHKAIAQAIFASKGVSHITGAGEKDA